jgi:hypothetical protein
MLGMQKQHTTQFTMDEHSYTLGGDESSAENESVSVT